MFPALTAILCIIAGVPGIVISPVVRQRANNLYEVYWKKPDDYGAQITNYHLQMRFVKYPRSEYSINAIAIFFLFLMISLLLCNYITCKVLMVYEINFTDYFKGNYIQSFFWGGGRKMFSDFCITVIFFY